MAALLWKGRFFCAIMADMEETRDNLQREKSETKESGFYTGPLPDPAVHEAYDPFNGVEPSRFIAELVGTREEEDAEAAEEEKIPRMPRAYILLSLALLLVLAAAFFIKRPAFVPLRMPQPTPTPAPEAEALFAPVEATPEATPENIVLPVLPVSAPTSAPEAAEYEKTMLIVDGEAVGAVASAEAAELLIGEVCAHFENRVRSENEIASDAVLLTDVENDIVMQSAPDVPDEALLQTEALFALFTGEDSPLRVLTRETHTEREVLEAGEEEEKDKYLLKGTQIIVDMGADGEIVKTKTVLYENGEKQRRGGEEKEEEREARARVVRVGSQKVDEDAESGKREGREGPDAEGLVFLEPLEEGKIVSNYGQRKGVLHLGLDYESEKENARVYASCSGRVVSRMERGGYGLTLEIDHGNGFLTRYAHLASAPVEIGDYVNAGDAVGFMGKSGNAEKAHLHFELRIHGEAYNPRFYLED